MSFLRQLLPLLLSLLLARAAEPAAPTEEVLRPPEPGRFKALFQPLRTDFAALSPDGKYLAYSLRESDSVSVAVVAIDHPEKMTALVKVIDDQAATPMLDMNQKEPTPGAIRWMRWTTPHRLVVETNQVFARADVQSNWQSWRGATRFTPWPTCWYFATTATVWEPSPPCVCSAVFCRSWHCKFRPLLTPCTY